MKLKKYLLILCALSLSSVVYSIESWYDPETELVWCFYPQPDYTALLSPYPGDEEDTSCFWFTNYNHFSGVAIVPTTVYSNNNAYTITRIDNYAFIDSYYLNSITIPNSVEFIGCDIFTGCNNLSTIIVESGNTKYDSRNGCNAIIETETNTLIAGCKSTIIPEDILCIDDGAFDCSSLTSITIPKNINMIKGMAFGRCFGLISVKVMQSNPLQIDTYCFSSNTCENGTLYVPAGSKSFYESARGWNKFRNIKEIILFDDAYVKSLCVTNWDTDGDGELSLDEAAAVPSLGTVFKNNTSITSFNELQYFTGLTTIEESAFQNCTSLTSITIPDGVTTISKYAFYNCGLTSLFIPKSVTSLVRAFPGCVNLESIVVDDENPTYCSPNNCNAIIRMNDMTLVQGCSNTVIPDGVRYIGPDAFRGCNFSTVSIPESVTYLDSWAYGGVTIDDIVIPTSITGIGESCFSGANINHIEIPYSETPITYSCYEESYHARTVFTEATIGTLVIDRKFSRNSSIIDYVAPFFLTTIDKLYEGLHGVNWYSSATINDFYLSEGLTDVNQNTSFKKYDDAVFKYGGGKSTINHLHIPEGVTSITKIYSTGNEIYIPSTVTSIADDAFSDIYPIYYAGGDRLCVTVCVKEPIAISENTFSSSRSEATLYVPYGCKAAYEASPYWQEFNEIIEMEAPPSNIDFADANVKAICIANWDTNHDGELSEAEAAAVTDLGKVFYNNKQITSFDELQYFTGLTSIGKDAFSGCNYLTSIIIPNSVVNIGNYAFGYCFGLTSITIPNSVTNIDIYPFDGCYFASDSFINNSTLTSANNWGAIIYDVETSDGLLIKSNVLVKCRPWATSVTIPDGVTSIDDNAFSACKDLTSVIIPNSVKNIGANAFNGLKGLTSITIPNSVTEIGQQAFYGCSGLTSVSIGNKVTRIGRFAFSGCSGLTSISIPNSVTWIGMNAFQNCDTLTDFWCYAPVIPTTENNLFKNTDIASATLHVPTVSLETYSNTVPWSLFGTIVAIDDTPIITFADPAVKALCVANWDTNGDGELSEAEAAAVTDLGTVFNGNTTITTFNELQYFTGLTSIGGNAFYGCTGLTSIAIPNNVTSIGSYAFCSCAKITSIIIPDGVTDIGNFAFAYCRHLAFVTLPENLTNINRYAFEYCTDLSSITIPCNVTYICDDAFYCCYFVADSINNYSELINNYFWGATICDEETNGLLIKTNTLYNNNSNTGTYFISGKSVQRCRSWVTSVTIPSDVTSIAEEAFLGCNNLTSVKVDIETPLSIDSYTFSNRTNATLYVPAGSKAAYEAADYWKNFKNIIGFIEGDVNSDNEVDVLDVVDIVRYVVDDPADTFVSILADINNNGEVNVGDAVALVNEIAGEQNFVKGLYAPQANNDDDDYSYESCELQLLKNSTNGLSFCMNGETDFTAFQFDLYLPAGIDATDMLLNAQRKQGHQLIYNKVEEGHYRVAAISTSNHTFSGYEGELLAVGLEGIASEDICLRNIRFFTTDGEEHRFDDIVMQSGTATDIASPLQPSNGEEAIYNLSGQRIQKMRKGINIINGKKIAF